MFRPIIFGEIEGITEGHWFEGRKEMMPSSFHRNWAAAIDGNGRDTTEKKERLLKESNSFIIC
jgi:putative restriction endonuclease